MIEICKAEHPRLFISQERINELKNFEKIDPVFAELKSGLIRKANFLLTEDVVLFKITGPRMLKNCQEIRSRVTTLALAYHLTCNMEYALRAKDELFSAASFPHWNKDHFLDTAELITAFAIGYDWLFHVLPDEDIELIKQSMIQKGINEGLREYKNNVWWADHKYNWNQVCNGGLIIGALAIADEEPLLCNGVFKVAAKHLPVAFNSYGEDGGWEAGPDYWQYTTLFSALLIDALQLVIHNDFGLSKTEGFEKTGLFPIYLAGPKDRFFNFADADEDYNSLPVLFWLGKQFNNDHYITENHRLLIKAINAKVNFDAFNLVWYMPAKNKSLELPLNYHFSDIELGVFRSGWENPNATFIAFKGGNNQADHAHLDLGSFVLDMNGVRWASELGRDSYDLPDYFDLSEGGGRWNYFRLNTKSHNTLVLNNDNQRALAKAAIISFEEKEDEKVAEIDLSEAYQPHAESVIRTIRLQNKGNVIISDTVEWAGSNKLFQWQMLTDAEIILGGNTAELFKDGEKMNVSILQPSDAVFEIISAEQEEPQLENVGYKLLIVRNTESGNSTKIEICLE